MCISQGVLSRSVEEADQAKFSYLSAHKGSTAASLQTVVKSSWLTLTYQLLHLSNNYIKSLPILTPYIFIIKAKIWYLKKKILFPTNEIQPSKSKANILLYLQTNIRQVLGLTKNCTLAETTLLSSTTGTNSGETRMTLDLMNVCFGSSLLVSNNRRQSRGPVTLLQKFLCNDVTFLSQLNSLF